MPEQTCPDDGMITASVAEAPPTVEPISIDVPSIAVPPITGGIWVSTRVVIVGIFFVAVLLGFGFIWLLDQWPELRHADPAQRVEGDRKRRDPDRIQQQKQKQAELERQQAIEKENRELERQREELKQERIWLEIENERLRHRPPPQPSRVIIVR